MFYDKYAQLCRQRGISPSAAALDAGLSKSLVTKWKVNNVDVPSPDVLKKLSVYFNIPVSELLGEEKDEEDKKEKPTVNDDELSEAKRKLIEKIKKLPEDQVLLLLQVAERLG